MNWEHVAIGLLSAVSALMGWFLREMWDAIKSLKRDLSALEVKIAERYVPSSDFDRAVERIMNSLETLHAAIANKVDRR